MTAELEVAYLGVQVADPTGFGTFLQDIVGLVPASPPSMAPPPGATTTACIASSSRRTGQRRGVRRPRGRIARGVRARRRSSVHRRRDRHARNRSEAAGRRVDALARVDTPWGVPFELVHGLASAATPFDSSLVPGGFVTKDQGFGHVVFVVSNLDEADRFAREALGFTQSDWLETDLAPGLR